MYSFSHFQAKAKESGDWLGRELAALRSGRASPALLDGVLVESYGGKMPIRNLAAIALEDPRTLRVTPFDSSALKDIEKAIAASGAGISVSLDERGARVHFPELTSERRAALIKAAKEKFEQARIKLRKTRDDILKDIEQKERQGGMGEDEKFRLKKDLDKQAEAENKKLHEMFERKEREILA